MKDLWKALDEGSTRKVLFCQKSGIDINAKYGNRTALHKAIQMEDIDMVSYLLKLGADVAGYIWNV